MFRKTPYLLCITCCPFAVGCFPGDPVRTTRQTISLRVVASAPGASIAGIRVQIKYDFRRDEEVTRRLSEDLRKNQQEGWDRQPWISCVTNRDGQVDATVVVTALDRTRGEKPPPDRDLRGTPYLVKVIEAQGSEEVLSIVMKPGEFVRGTRFMVSVLEIHDPIYADPNP